MREEKIRIQDAKFMIQPAQPSKTITSKRVTLLAGLSVLGGLVIGGLGFSLSALSRLVSCQNVPTQSLTRQILADSDFHPDQEQELARVTNRYCGGLDLILFFPLLLAVAEAGAMVWVIRKGKVANLLVVMSFSALSGLILYGTYHGLQYLSFRQEVAKYIVQKIAQDQPVKINQKVDQFLKRETGITGFWGYLKFEAQVGIVVVGGWDQSSHLEVKNAIAWRWWLLDLALIQVGAGLGAYEVTRKPFCKNCQDWYSQQEFVGFVESDSAEVLLYLLKSNQLAKAGELICQVLQPEGGLQLLLPEGCVQVLKQGYVQVLKPQADLDNVIGRRLGVYVEHCPHGYCCDCIISVSLITLTAKGAIANQEVWRRVLSPSQEAAFWQGMGSS